MKRTGCYAGDRGAAFTLIEMIVVICIIAVLAGLAFPVFQSVQNSANRVQAKNDLHELVTAVRTYYGEYGRWPGPDVASGAYDYDIRDYNIADMCNVLRANAISWDNPSGTQNLNPRRVIFLNARVARNAAAPKGGVASDGRYYDPWGTSYLLRLDWDYNNTITNPYSNAGPDPLSTDVIGWSYGKDRKPGAGGKMDANALGFDDVMSW